MRVRKANKILMATVAILLCLVLISTSVVSGIFARYVIQKQASVKMNIEAFGVTLSVSTTVSGATVNATKNKKLDYSTAEKLSDSLNIEISNLQMAPGDEFFDALRVQITNSPNVPIIFRMSCRIEYDTTKYVYNSKSYMPLGYTMHFGNVDNNIDICYPYKENTDGSKLGEIVVRNIYNNLYGTNYTEGDKPNDVIFQDTETSDWCFVKSYAAGSSGDNILAADAKARDFYLGFDFPDKGRNGNNKGIDRDAIATALSENAAGSQIKIIFSFTIEQA